MSERPMYDMSDCVYGYDWEEPSHVFRDARHYKRATAIGLVANEFGNDFQDHRCTTRYARWLTEQEIWDLGAGERWWDDQGVLDPVTGRWVGAASDGPPPGPPDDWKPDPERDLAFEMCERGDEGAIKVYMIETGL